MIRSNQDEFRSLLTEERLATGKNPDENMDALHSNHERQLTDAVAIATQSGWPAALPPPDLSELMVLLRWFKRDFFVWVDRPKCEATGGATEFVGMAPPTVEEQRWGAQRVEVYRGPNGHLTRFPRYNNPEMLLRTRRGRCGEWANAFGLLATATGFDVRWVLDVTDHVWCEVWSCHHQRWVHCDPCEEACDAPLLYETGWGKSLSHVLAFGRCHCADVSRRYTLVWEEALRRRAPVAEGWLELFIAENNARAAAALALDERKLLAAKLEAEESQLAAEVAARREACAWRRYNVHEAQVRSSGEETWRLARGEMGPNVQLNKGGGDALNRSGDDAQSSKESVAASVPQRVTRILGAAGAVVHGICFEYDDGSREGVVLDHPTGIVTLFDEASLVRRGGTWHELYKDETIARVSGSASQAPGIKFLAGRIVLTLTSGREISFRGNDDAMCAGESFEFSCQQALDGVSGAGVRAIAFEGGAVRGVTCFNTENEHQGETDEQMST
eukprot:scaffold292800_cov30-Tisochrysis_lutea.AAC.1